MSKAVEKRKSLFIHVAMLSNLGMALHAGTALVRGAPPLAWTGVLVATLSLLVRLGLPYLRPMPRGAAHLPGLLALISGGLALALGATVAGRGAGPLPLLYSALGLANAVLYIFWFSPFGRRPSQVLTPGHRLPSFVLEDEAGREVSSESFLGAPTLFLFYRGNWCPLCMAQVGEVAGRYRELERRGVKVVLVSPQPHRFTRELAQRFSVPFHFLVDVEGRVARRLDIVHEGGAVMAGPMGFPPDTVFPTVLVTASDGTVLLCDQTDNYRLRPEPDTFLAVLDARPEAKGA